ncbi:4Fe-4S dicluster domain-containing protein [Desulfovibrio inopinatus]|uniref:4Fe-4S dicluster domain-containing protein n=1 Tax=Desulfovibrio inopinatus TaxID=102109 RepID=UPI0003F98204|nr:4Fe-4S dicluster domain-containing protein [Desulfovibrio inopinatus]
MDVVFLDKTRDDAFVAEVERESGQNVALCYQCGNCTAGCPYTFAYDIPVSQIMRLLQAGQKDRLLKCKSIWLCATCESCTTRCPNNIDVAKIMDVLRHQARRHGLAGERNVKVFWDAFLDSVKAHGRVFELGALATYVTRTGRFWTDMDLGPKIFPKGKIGFKPHDIKGKDEVKKIFDRFMEESSK